MKNLILSSALFLFVGLTTFAQTGVSKDPKTCEKKCEMKGDCRKDKCDKACEMKCASGEASSKNKSCTKACVETGATADSKMMKAEKAK